MRTNHIVLAALVALAALPLTALVTHAVTGRGRHARAVARQAERSRAALEQERDAAASALEQERERQTAGPLDRGRRAEGCCRTRLGPR